MLACFACSAQQGPHSNMDSADLDMHMEEDPMSEGDDSTDKNGLKIDTPPKTESGTAEKKEEPADPKPDPEAEAKPDPVTDTQPVSNPTDDDPAEDVPVEDVPAENVSADDDPVDDSKEKEEQIDSGRDDLRAKLL